MRSNRPTSGRNYSREQKVEFESHVPFSKCLRAKLYSNINVYFDPQGCQILLLKENELLLFSLGSWTMGKSCYEKWTVNEPGVFYSLFYVQSREIPRKMVARVARNQNTPYLKYV